MEKDPRGTHFIGIGHKAVSWAVAELIRGVQADELAKLKVGSGEHLAALLATAFLGTAPTSVDTDGGPDLVFDVTTSNFTGLALRDLVGRIDVQFADFEVKSLPGTYRQFEAEFDKATAAGVEPRETWHWSTFVAANDVVRAAGGMIENASKQLARKSASDRARGVFLIAHFFDHPFVEVLEPVIAHHLEAPDLPEGVDSVWMLFAPYSLVVWSADLGRWTELIFGVGDPSTGVFEVDGDMALLQHFEAAYLEQAGALTPSPFFYKLTTHVEE
ncbi:hypothetical protein OG747_52570 (plasmid) [Streptomyces sp. NBC_01384]|uniref:hypothetical protein n=1 Tax=Streptomyces sp. NBC_01384 TaxID=2903847 RepID=UPI002F907E7B